MEAALLGAGFSCWAAGLPVASDLFDFNVTLLSKKEERRLPLVKRDWERWTELAPNAPSELFIRWCIETSKQRGSRVAWYVTRRLSEPFLAPMLGCMQTLMIDERRAAEHPGVRRAQRFLGRFIFPGAPGIVTTNYDLLIEYSLGTRGINYGHCGEVLKGRGKNPQFPWQGSRIVLAGPIPLAKVHGSLSWDKDYRYTDGRAGLRGGCLIVPPSPEKTAPEDLQVQWDLARSIIAGSNKLVVFGFGFNPYDAAFLQLLREAGTDLDEVELIDLWPNEAAATDLWPKARIVSRPPSLAGPFTL